MDISVRAKCTEPDFTSDYFQATHPDILILAHQQRRASQKYKHTQTLPGFSIEVQVQCFLQICWLLKIFFNMLDQTLLFTTMQIKNWVIGAFIIHESELSKFAHLNYEFSNFQAFYSLWI